MTSEQTIFLNGRAQVVEMLQHMDQEHKKTLLNNIRQRNPSLALELMENSITFEHIGSLPKHELMILINYVKAPIMAIALKSVTLQLQKKVLATAPRDYASEAYSIMIKPIQNEKINIKKARTRILEILINLYKNRQIHFEQ